MNTMSPTPNINPSWDINDLKARKEIVDKKGEQIQKCLEYAIARLGEYHNQGAKGLIVDDAMYDVYVKMESALKAYTSYNDRVTKKINAKIADMTSSEPPRKTSSVPRRKV